MDQMTNKLQLQNEHFCFPVRFSWVGLNQRKFGSDNLPLNWGHAMAAIVETFGLPGDRYVSKFDEDDLVFLFHDEQDAALCILKFR